MTKFRFGGALDEAASMFSEAFDSGIIPMDFVNNTKKDGKLIMGIGHRVKSLNNPDKVPLSIAMPVFPPTFIMFLKSELVVHFFFGGGVGVVGERILKVVMRKLTNRTF